MMRTSSVVAAAILAAFPAVGRAQPLEGQIVRDAAHPAWFKYHGGGPFYMCGPGDPEGFLYRGTLNPDGTRNGDQAALIARLAGTGANCIYFQAVRSHGGDGDATHNPFIANNPNNALNQPVLDQWETWFTAMDDNGIVIFFFFYDDSSSPYGRNLPANGQLANAEAAFIDAIVARFKHHRHLIWCVAEEYAEGLSAAHAVKIAERIRQQDNRQHPVAIHQNNSTSFDFNGNPAFDQFAVQWNVSTAAALHAGAVAAWNNVGGLVNINLSEFADGGTGATLRRKLWAIALGGAYGMVLEMDIASTPLSDLQDCGRLVAFMQATRFNETAPHDELARADTDYVLADPGEVYIAWADAGGTLGLSVPAGHYLVRWYNPVSGGWVEGGGLVLPGGDRFFIKPAGLGDEAALYLERVHLPPAPAGQPSPADGAGRVPRTVVLSWSPAPTALSHDVYFGTVAPGTPRGNQAAAVFDPGPLRFSTTYYWRIDEVNGAGTTTGAVWSFTTGGLPADADTDGDVDQEDFGFFQACLTLSITFPIAPGCEFANLNGDELVDQTDLTLFLACFSGPGIPADPACAGPP